MITIDGNGSVGYSLKFSAIGVKSFTQPAKTLPEVYLAIGHYMVDGNLRQEHASNQIASCPLCRSLKLKAEKDARADVRVTYKNVERLAQEKGLVFWARAEKHDGRLVQRYSLAGNGVEMGLMTLAEAIQEIKDWKNPEN